MNSPQLGAGSLVDLQPHAVIGRRVVDRLRQVSQQVARQILPHADLGVPRQPKRDALQHLFLGKQAFDEHRHRIFQQQVSVAAFGVEREEAMGGGPKRDDHHARRRPAFPTGLATTSVWLASGGNCSGESTASGDSTAEISVSNTCCTMRICRSDSVPGRHR